MPMTTPGQAPHDQPPVARADQESRRSRSESSAPAQLAAADRAGRVRIAAVGDLHVTVDRAGRFRPALRRVHAQADVLLLAGDLTQRGTLAEARCVAEEVADLGLPVFAVLGNHDHLSGHAHAVAAMLGDRGVRVLEQTATVVTVAGLRLGVAGVMGFGGGFAPAADGRRDERAERFGEVLRGLVCDVRVALTHYAPVAGTLSGEPERLFGVLGSQAIGAAIDASGTHLAVHGHAHHGQEHGATPGGVPVRNVAYPVIRQEFRLYDVQLLTNGGVRVTTVRYDRVGGWARWAWRRSSDLAGRAARRRANGQQSSDGSVRLG
jgi:Icc-related predicted phosphoesterase